MAVYDASVLYPSLIRNLLMYLGTEGLVATRWTAAIHDEWTHNLLEDRPDLIDTLSLPDPDDRHVLAAAIHADAELIVTQNLKHFPAEALTPHGIEALTPDTLICRLLEAEPAATRTAIEKLRASLRKPPYDTAQLLARLGAVGLTESTERLKETFAKKGSE